MTRITPDLCYCYQHFNTLPGKVLFIEFDHARGDKFIRHLLVDDTEPKSPHDIRKAIEERGVTEDWNLEGTKKLPVYR